MTFIDAYECLRQTKETLYIFLFNHKYAYNSRKNVKLYELRK